MQQFKLSAARTQLRAEINNMVEQGAVDLLYSTHGR